MWKNFLFTPESICGDFFCSLGDAYVEKFPVHIKNCIRNLRIVL